VQQDFAEIIDELSAYMSATGQQEGNNKGEKEKQKKEGKKGREREGKRKGAGVGKREREREREREGERERVRDRRTLKEEGLYVDNISMKIFRGCSAWCGENEAR
jgi:hypothetical protein